MGPGVLPGPATSSLYILSEELARDTGLTSDSLYASLYTTFTNFSIKYLVMCMVYTDDGGIK